MTQQFSREQRFDPSASPGPAYVWGVPGRPLTVRLPFDLIDSLERLAVENFRSIEARGSEIGGLLFGGADPGDPGKVRIDDFEPVMCDYSRGPFYRLSDADLARFDAAIEKRGGAAEARVAGFFRSHSRKGLALDPEDMKAMEARFREPWQVALLVRPFATKVSAGGIFIWEDGRMRGDASYLEFPFRSSELTAAENPPEVRTEAPLPSPKPLTRAAVLSMPSRPKVAPPPAEPLPILEERIEAVSVAASQPAPPEPPKPVESIPEPETVEADAPAPAARGSRGKLLWVAVAAALVACSGALFVYPGLFRHAPRPPAALSLRIERTATDLLLTWNRDSDAVRNARKAVLSISDGDRQENLDLNLSDLRNGSIVYSPLSSDVSFRMEVTGPDQSKTASESVRVLRTKPSPMPPDAATATPAKPGSAQRESNQASPSGAADQPAPEAAAVGEPVAPKRAPAPTFNVASLAQRLRPALPTDLPEAPALAPTPGVAGSINLGALTPAGGSAIPAPVAPSQAKTAPEPPRDIRQPVLTSRVNPVYPDIARQQRISGTVSLAVVIGANGKITSVTALSGPELLRRPAVDAVKQWVYTPMTLNGHPVETQKQIDLNFTLNR